MTDLFNQTDVIAPENKPLADAMRPANLADMVGQSDLIGADGIVTRMTDGGHLANLVLWGPPGCGKTTMARAIANASDMDFVPMSAVFSGIADVKRVMDAARTNMKIGRRTLLFIDEIHRFNKTQQDTLLPYLEDGTCTFIGATTENPSFNLNNALLSRCHLCVLKPLSVDDLAALVRRAESHFGRKMPLNADARAELCRMAGGDARFLWNSMEYIANLKLKSDLDVAGLHKSLARRAAPSDKAGDEHYNLISAVHKSLRASDVDAAIYWVARMMVAGQDPKYIFRRLTRFAVEDIGLADPNAATVALNAWQIYERLGSPEGDLAMTQLVIYLASAPKSNANYVAAGRAFAVARETGELMPPPNILNAPTKMMKDIGYGAGYVYDHDAAGGVSGQNCWPDAMGAKNFYTPKEIGFERDIKKRIDYWNTIRAQK